MHARDICSMKGIAFYVCHQALQRTPSSDTSVLQPYRIQMPDALRAAVCHLDVRLVRRPEGYDLPRIEAGKGHTEPEAEEAICNWKR